MDAHDRRELEELRAAQKALQDQMRLLDERLGAISERLERVGEKEELAVVLPMVSSPPISEVCMPDPVAPPVIPPPLPRSLSPESSVPKVASAVEGNGSGLGANAQPTPASSTSESSSLEIQIGRVWLVRIGVAMLLTGLVFLGNYVISKIGPVGKLLMLYASGIGLAGLGIAFERGKESLLNYSRVLLAGGLAVVYYSTYAAHFVPALRVVQSPLLGGLLLLGLAAFIVFLADRKKSQTLALFAVILSYYTSAINPISDFTLYSNLLLTVAAVFFMVRNQWTAISVASLIATYLSYGYWQFFRAWHLPFHWSSSPADFWHGTLFLAIEFVLFTVAAFVGNYQGFTGGRRTAFLSLNNAAFFLLVAPRVAMVYPESFWSFSLGFGIVLMGLGGAALRWRKEELHMDAAYFAQGLLLITVAIVTKLAGYQLALVLAVESAVLLACCRERNGWLWLGAASVCATGALGLSLNVFLHDSSKILLLGGSCSLIYLFNARWIKHLSGTEETFDPKAAFYCGYALLLGGVIIWDQARGGSPTTNVVAPAFAIAAGVLMYSVRLHGLQELAVLVQTYVFAAIGYWFLLKDKEWIPWWQPMSILLVTLAAAHRVKKDAVAGSVLSGFFAVGIVVLLHTWLHSGVSLSAWTLISAILATALLVYGILARFPEVSLVGQWFAISCAVSFYWGYKLGHPGWMLASIGLFLVLGLLVRGFMPETPGLASGRNVSWGYRWVALLMFLQWGFHYISRSHQFLFFVFFGGVLFLVALMSKELLWAVFSGILLLAGLGVFWSGEVPLAFFSNLGAIFLLLALTQLAKKADSSPYRQVMLVITLATFWLFASRWGIQREISLTIIWAAASALVFAFGIGLRERIGRLSGLVILAGAVGRVFSVDVWQLGTLTRIASFMVLGIVLLLLGFLYNRFAEKFREWL